MKIRSFDSGVLCDFRQNKPNFSFVDAEQKPTANEMFAHLSGCQFFDPSKGY